MKSERWCFDEESVLEQVREAVSKIASPETGRCWNNSYGTWIVKLWRSWAIYPSGQDARAERTRNQTHRAVWIPTVGSSVVLYSAGCDVRILVSLQ